MPSQRARVTPLEISVILIAILFLVVLLRKMLSGETTMIHDNLYAEYPIFRFLFEHWSPGRDFPYWDPNPTGGIPAYPAFGHARLLDPFTLLVMAVGKLYTNDAALVANWNRVLQSLFMAAGVYLVYRPWVENAHARLALIPPIFLSYLILGSFRQPGLFYLFAWIPYIAYFFLRIAHYGDSRITSWILLGAAVGMNWQSYYFVSTWVLLALLATGFFLFHREKLVHTARTSRWKILVCGLIVVAMMAPNLTLYLEMDRFSFPLRMQRAAGDSVGPILSEGGPETRQTPTMMAFETIAQEGTYLNALSLLYSLAPDGAFHVGNAYSGQWRILSDGHYYLGVLVWLIALYGIWFAHHPLKKVWTVLLIGFLVCLLGPNTPLYRPLHALYLPIRFLRHTSFLMPCVYFVFLFFFALGLNHLSSPDRTPIRRSFLQWTGFAISACVPLLLVSKQLPNPAYFVLMTVSLVGLALLGFRRLGPLAIALCLFIDFSLAARWAEPFYGSLSNPSTLLGVPATTSSQARPLPRTLYATPLPPLALRGTHYLASIYETPAMLTTPLIGEPRSLEAALALPRVADFLVPRTYLQLIHLEIPAEAMRSIFAVGENPIQFKAGARRAQLSDFNPLLNSDPELTRNTLFIDGESFLDSGDEPGTNHFMHRVLNYDGGQLDLALTSDHKGYLYWADAFDPWWRAWLDGREVPILRANLNFKAIRLPAGDHRVEFRYRPLWFIASLRVFYSACFFAVFSPLLANLLCSFCIPRRNTMST